MKNSQKGVKNRIRKLVSDENITIQQFSDLIGIPKGTVEKYLNGQRLPSAEFLSAIYSHMGVSAHWLLDGVEPQVIGKTSKNTIQIESGDASINSDSVLVPKLSVEASAGGGIHADDELETGVYSFSKKWLNIKGLNSNSLSVISVKGDSMEPDLQDGDLILINHADNVPKDSKIYAVRYSGDLFVKRVQTLPGNKIALCSSNKNYETITIELSEDPKAPLDFDLSFIGRVVSSMHEW